MISEVHIRGLEILETKSQTIYLNGDHLPIINDREQTPTSCSQTYFRS
jgi:hypothetical protein